MKHILRLLLLFISSVSIRADRMMDIMRNYNAKTMSVAEMDSVLLGDEAMRREGEKALRYKLEYKNEQKLFRHSFYADYYLVDTQKKDTLWLSDVPVRDARMSPNGKYVVYAKAELTYIFIRWTSRPKWPLLVVRR